MVSDLNTLTAQVMRGEISCGAYADAVHALQSGAPVRMSGVADDNDARECNRCGEGLTAATHHVDMINGQDACADCAGDDVEECAGCGCEIAGEDVYWDNERQAVYCDDCTCDNLADDSDD